MDLKVAGTKMKI
jgi:hypothetical protein